MELAPASMSGFGDSGGCVAWARRLKKSVTQTFFIKVFTDIFRRGKMGFAAVRPSDE